MTPARKLWLLAVAGTLLFARASAAILRVGHGLDYATPSDASAVAKPGDTVQIAPGTYFDCTVWRVDRLVIEGSGAQTILIDKVCEDKAIFVIQSNDVTVRAITFRHARSTEGNGSGVRMEGTNLTVDHARFIDNQDGILTGANPQSRITIRDSEFDRNGTCVNDCAHGVYAGHVAELRIEHSRFFATRVGHAIKSRAARTIVIANQFEDGPTGTASNEIDVPNGGIVEIIANTMQKGPRSENHTAIRIGEEGVTQPTPYLLIKDNVFENDAESAIFVHNLTKVPAQVIDNRLLGRSVRPLEGIGIVRRRSR